jgi:hypothetical protein
MSSNHIFEVVQQDYNHHARNKSTGNLHVSRNLHATTNSSPYKNVNSKHDRIKQL